MAITTTNKIRVYELARELHISNKELMARLRERGMPVSSHMAVLSPSEAARIAGTIARERAGNDNREAPGVVRRRHAQPRREPVARPGPGGTIAKEPRPAAAPAATPESGPAPESRPQATTARPAVEASTSEDMRGRFERQLHEARRRTEAKRREEDRQRAETQARAAAEAAQARQTGRPAVGDVIPLVQPKVAPPGAAPARAAPPRPQAQRSSPGPGPGPGPGQRAPAGAAPAGRASNGRPAGAAPAGRAGAGRPGPGFRREVPGHGPRPPRRGPAGAPARPAGRGGPPGPRAPRGSQRTYGRGRPGPQPGGERPRPSVPAEHKRIVKIQDTISVGALARAMSYKPAALLARMWTMGMTGLTINSSLDFETAALIASELGFTAQNVAFHEEQVLDTAPQATGASVPRSPVVTITGHVDHGKTTLLDTIRKSHVAAGEAGGITQHIGAYRVSAPEIGDVVFVDTPGHEAFTAIRARGASVTDIVILVVAADDGVMPQTLEALDHARQARVPVIVAVSKCDLPAARPDRVRTQLAEHGLIPEEWGGSTLYVDVSAARGQGIDELLEAIALQAEILELRADPSRPATGAVLEARLDRGRGPVATVLVQDGTLRVGDTVVVGELSGRVRTMHDDKGQPQSQAGPATPVEIAGLSGVPEAGDSVHVTDEITARRVVEHRMRRKRELELAASRARPLDRLVRQIRAGRNSETTQSKQLGVVLKADVHGSAEALKDALERQSTDKLRVNVIHAGVGGISESDVRLAQVGNAIIVGFNVRPAGKAAELAHREGVEIRLYSVIYELLDDIRSVMLGLLPPVKSERSVGTLEVRELFHVPKVGVVAGCMVTAGIARRSDMVRIIRDSVRLPGGASPIRGLRRFKEDMSAVHQGQECGVLIDAADQLRPGDILEVYEVIEEAPSLGTLVSRSRSG